MLLPRLPHKYYTSPSCPTIPCPAVQITPSHMNASSPLSPHHYHHSQKHVNTSSHSYAISYHTPYIMPFPPHSNIPSLRPKHSATTTPSLRLPLHLLANLDINLEELGHTSVQAHGLALVEIGFAVRCVDAFVAAGFEETMRALASIQSEHLIRACVEHGTMARWNRVVRVAEDNEVRATEGSVNSEIDHSSYRIFLPR
jgi:hypothetical protein